eukprot:scaffold48181_cov63-Phaeocystis_antarctica.AAC.1
MAVKRYGGMTYADTATMPLIEAVLLSSHGSACDANVTGGARPGRPAGPQATGPVSRQQAALDAGSARRAREGPGSAPAAQTPSALGQPAVHLHVVVDRLRTGRMEGYRRGCRWAIGGFGAAREGPKGTARDGISVRTGMAVSSFFIRSAELRERQLMSTPGSRVQPLGFRVDGRHLVQWASSTPRGLMAPRGSR